MHALPRWQQLIASLTEPVFFQQAGTLIVWHRQDAAEAQRFTRVLEANLRAYLLWGFSAFASVAYTHALAATSPDSPLPRVPPVHGVAALEFRRPRTIFSFIQLMMRWAGPQRRLSAEDLFDPTICLASTRCGGTPGFVMVSLRSALRLSRQIQLTAAIDNITNESYRFHGSGLNGPGIGARLGLDANY